MNNSEVKQIILGKIGHIFMTGLVCAVIAAGYKYCFTPLDGYKGDFQYTRLIQIINGKESSDSRFEFNYPGLINTDSCYVEFLKSAEGTVGLSKINSSWENLNQQAKVKWFRKYVRFGNFHDNVYELVFTLQPNSIKDISYLNKNISKLMDLFVKNGTQFIKKVKPDAEIKSVSEAVLLPEKTVNDKKAIALKYSVFGFIAGGFLSMAIFIGISLFKKIQD